MKSAIIVFFFLVGMMCQPAIAGKTVDHAVSPGSCLITFCYSSPEYNIEVYTDNLDIFLKETFAFESFMDAVEYWKKKDSYGIDIIPSSFADSTGNGHNFIHVEAYTSSVERIYNDPVLVDDRLVVLEPIFINPYVDELFYCENIFNNGDAVLTDAEIVTNSIEISTCRIGDTVDSIIDRLNVDVDIPTKGLKEIWFTDLSSEHENNFYEMARFTIVGGMLQTINIVNTLYSDENSLLKQ